MLHVDAKSLVFPLPAEAARRHCQAIEAGEIIHLGPTPIGFRAEDLAFLRDQRQSGGGHHKNIAYRPRQDRLTGFAGSSADAVAMRALMKRFSREALAFLGGCLAPYRFESDYASFRPLEEEGRAAKLTARNDLLHVDSFPTRPSRGRRILRFFVNVNPEQNRVWRTGPAFPALAREFAATSGLLDRYRQDAARPAWQSGLGNVLGSLGLRAHFRPPYDRFMLSFHDWLKANHEFQDRPHPVTEFAPMTSWMVMTDTVSHAVLRGRFALEQTVWVHPDSLQARDAAPAEVLKALAAG